MHHSSRANGLQTHPDNSLLLRGFCGRRRCLPLLLCANLHAQQRGHRQQHPARTRRMHAQSAELRLGPNGVDAPRAHLHACACLRLHVLTRARACAHASARVVRLVEVGCACEPDASATRGGVAPTLLARPPARPHARPPARTQIWTHVPPADHAPSTHARGGPLTAGCARESSACLVVQQVATHRCLFESGCFHRRDGLQKTGQGGSGPRP